MQCAEVMKRFIHSVEPTDTIQVAARKMREANVGILPVSEQGRVVGVVTDRDLAIRVCAEAVEPSMAISYVMSPGVIACRPSDAIATAEKLMREHHITRVLVTDEEGRLVGLLSLSDLAFYEPPSRTGRTLRGVAERKYEPESGP